MNPDSPETVMHETWLAFGANLGNRLAAIRFGVAGLAAAGVELVESSSIYTSRPKYRLDQPPFLNCVGHFRTVLEPRALLEVCQRVEHDAGRQQRSRYGPRELDIDILLYDDLQLHEADLQLPHPGIAKRLFVLVPLAELAPTLPVPGTGDVGALLREARRILPVEEEVSRVGPNGNRAPVAEPEGRDAGS